MRQSFDRAIAQPHSSHFTQVNAARKAIPTQVPISPHSPATPQPTQTPPCVTQLPMHVQLLKRVQLHNTAVGSAPTRPVVGIPVHSAHSPFRVVPQSDVAVATETAVRTSNPATTGATVIAMMRDDEEEPPPKRRLSDSIGEKDSNVAVTLAGMSNSQQTTANATSPTAECAFNIQSAYPASLQLHIASDVNRVGDGRDVVRRLQEQSNTHSSARGQHAALDYEYRNESAARNTLEQTQ